MNDDVEGNNGGGGGVDRYSMGRLCDYIPRAYLDRYHTVSMNMQWDYSSTCLYLRFPSTGRLLYPELCLPWCVPLMPNFLRASESMIMLEEPEMFEMKDRVLWLYLCDKVLLPTWNSMPSSNISSLLWRRQHHMPARYNMSDKFNRRQRQRVYSKPGLLVKQRTEKDYFLNTQHFVSLFQMAINDEIEGVCESKDLLCVGPLKPRHLCLEYNQVCMELAYMLNCGTYVTLNGDGDVEVLRRDIWPYKHYTSGERYHREETQRNLVVGADDQTIAVGFTNDEMSWRSLFESEMGEDVSYHRVNSSSLLAQRDYEPSIMKDKKEYLLVGNKPNLLHTLLEFLYEIPGVNKLPVGILANGNRDLMTMIVLSTSYVSHHKETSYLLRRNSVLGANYYNISKVALNKAAATATMLQRGQERQQQRRQGISLKAILSGTRNVCGALNLHPGKTLRATLSGEMNECRLSWQIPNRELPVHNISDYVRDEFQQRQIQIVAPLPPLPSLLSNNITTSTTTSTSTKILILRKRKIEPYTTSSSTTTTVSKRSVADGGGSAQS